MEKNKIIGTVYAVLTAVIFGITPILSNLIFTIGGNPMTLTFYRNLISIPILLIIMILKKENFRLNMREAMEIFLVGVIFRCTTNVCLYSSYDYIGVGMGTVIHFLYPLFTALIGFLLFKKHINKARIIAIFIAIIGLILAIGKINSLAYPGIILAVVSAITYSAYLIGMEETTLNKMDPFKVMFYISVFSSISLPIFDIKKREIIYRLSYKIFIMSSLIALFTSVIAYILLIKAIRYIGAVNVSIYGLLEPLVGVVLGIIIFHEIISSKSIIGCILIFIAILIPIISDFKNYSRNEKTVNIK